MKTVIIELTSPRANAWLHDMEELKIIRVVKAAPKKIAQPSLSEKYAGSISKKTAINLKRKIAKGKKEWERVF